jgi:hypothetical protein
VNKDELAGKTLAELRGLAKSRGLTGIAKLRKADLIARLLGVGAGPRKAAGRATPRPIARPKAAERNTGPTARPKAAGKKTVRPASAKPAEPRTRAAAGKATRPGARAKESAQRRRVAKRPSGGEPEARGLSPRTRRAFSVYRPLAEHRVKASKYYLGVPESPELDEGFAYPETYGENAITLMVRDPYWLFTYWEFAPELRADLVGRIGEEALLASRLVLRVYDVTGVDPDHANEYRDIDIAPGARNWYINVMRVEREYCVDVGLITPDGSFVVIARSNRVTLPPVGPSDVVDEEWVTLESLEEVYRRVERGPTSGSGGWGSGGWGSGGWCE